MKNKRVYLVLIILICIIALLPSFTYAALQANPSTHYKYKKMPEQWMPQIRQMEAPNNAMGLVEGFNSDLTPTTSNNIDVHMMRNTEYGAIAILSVSGYGNPQTIQSSSTKTTTGNTTGIYYTSSDNTYRESVAGCKTTSGYASIWINVIGSRYYDLYGGYRVGDAMNMKWHGTVQQEWGREQQDFLSRNMSGIFGWKSEYNHSGWMRFSRGVAVCGEGF